jgi:hypothetical protein
LRLFPLFRIGNWLPFATLRQGASALRMSSYIALEGALARVAREGPIDGRLCFQIHVHR